jgi:hypothetical protein
MDLDYYRNSLTLATNEMNSKIKVEVTHADDESNDAV